MLTNLTNLLKNTMTRKMALAAATAAGIAGLTPTLAQAHERHHDRDVVVDVQIGSDCPVRRYVPPVCEERVTQVWVEPCYRTVCDQVYVAPVYQTVCERVYCQPVYQTACEQVYVPERC